MSMLLSCVSDGKVKDMSDNTPSADKGSLTINIETRTESGAMRDHILCIYKNESGKSTLVRKYDSAKSDMQKPEYIWLLAGNYTAKVESGTAVSATFNEAEQYFYGEKDFDITAGAQTSVDVVATMKNIPVEVVFDNTIIEGFHEGYNVEVKADEAVKLVYTESKKGYFILPENCNVLTWHFVGTLEYEDGEKVAVDKSGTIENVESKKAYKLSFKFSKDASGFLGGDLSVTLDESVEERDDHLSFSPDPELKGVGFDINAPCNYTGGARQYLATAAADFCEVTLTIGDKVFDPVNEEVAGVTLAGLNSPQLYITLSDDFFNSLSEGEQIIDLCVTETSHGEARKSLCYNLQGARAYDSAKTNLWNGTALLSATVFGMPSSVEIIYREGEGEWNKIAASASQESNTYEANIEGIGAGRTYEYSLVVNDKKIGTSVLFTTVQGAQIPNGDMESWCVSDKVTYPGPSVNSKYWDSGNEGTSMVGETLTSSSTDIRPGSKGQYSALLDSKTIDAVIMKQFGAGNIFVGDFGEASLTPIGATVYFGQPFTYNAKPKGVKMWVKYNCGTIDNKGSAGVNTGEPDLTKIFCCVCNWESAWCVDSTKANETTFSPSMNDIKNCTDGRYDGVLYTAYFESRTSNTEWHELYIPFEKIEGTDDSSGANYLVLTATCSGYGDYFTGSSDSWMYVDDIELVY